MISSSQTVALYTFSLIDHMRLCIISLSHFSRIFSNDVILCFCLVQGKLWLPLSTSLSSRSGFSLQPSAFSLQPSGMSLFYIRVSMKALVPGSITKWSPNSTSWLRSRSRSRTIYLDVERRPSILQCPRHHTLVRQLSLSWHSQYIPGRIRIKLNSSFKSSQQSYSPRRLVSKRST